MKVYEEVKKALQDIVAPELKALQGEIKALQVEIKRLDEKIDVKFDSLRNELISEIRRVDNRIDSLESKLETAIDIRERLAALEAKNGYLILDCFAFGRLLLFPKRIRQNVRFN